MRNKGIKPPITIPKVIALTVGSIKAATKSAMTCATAAPVIPEIYPLELNFKNLFIPT